jgi:hypothetical protein
MCGSLKIPFDTLVVGYGDSLKHVLAVSLAFGLVLFNEKVPGHFGRLDAACNILFPLCHVQDCVQLLEGLQPSSAF